MNPTGKIDPILMFTGLIEGVGKTLRLEYDSEGGAILEVGDLPWPEKTAEGDSVAVNGVCLTAIGDATGSFTAELSPETLDRSNLGELYGGRFVNLERPLRIGDRLGGHLVQGHVDGLGQLTRLDRTGEFWILGVEFPKSLERYVVEKGSIAIDGISLTVASLSGTKLEVAVIPKTMELTNLGSRKIGDRLNLEIDIIAKYVERMVFTGENGSSITEEFLKKHGYL
jgi:riboflavin synthase